MPPVPLQVVANVSVLALLSVVATAVALIPVMLWGLSLHQEGWRAVDVALFGSMLASTDAVAVSAILKAANGPELLTVMLEGESLFNDATSLTLFEVFREMAAHPDEQLPLLQQLWMMAGAITWLTVGGAAVGLLLGLVTKQLLRVFQYLGLKPVVEVVLSLAMAYLSFFIAQACPAAAAAARKPLIFPESRVTQGGGATAVQERSSVRRC